MSGGSRRERARADVLAAIAAGGMVGATARYGLARALPPRDGHFPWATLWTNLSGSFVLGFLLVLLLERFPPTRYARPFLATGVLGAYTTMSTYAVDVDVLAKDGHLATGAVYGAGSVVAGVTLAFVGMSLARRTPIRRQQERP